MDGFFAVVVGVAGFSGLVGGSFEFVVMTLLFEVEAVTPRALGHLAAERAREGKEFGGALL